MKKFFLSGEINKKTDKKTLALRIGDKVRWTAGRIRCIGVVSDEDKGLEKVSILSHSIDNRRDHRYLEIDRKLLKLCF